jgi:phosphate transport system protein
MSHYQERLEQDLREIRNEIEDVGRKVAKAVHDAVHALLTGNRELAYATVLGDHPVNRQTRRLDRRCHAFVVRHLPSAGHLRFVSSVLRLSIALERIGDYAVTIAREAARLGARPPAAVARDVELLASQAEGVLEQALAAFLASNAELARGTASLSDQADVTFEKVWNDLLAEGRNGAHPLVALFAYLEVFERLSRVADQAKNICEETIFTVTGESKAPKVYRVLFVDETDDGPTQLAVAFARKAFPKSGRYASAGFAPAEELDGRCARFLEERGYGLAGLAPKRLEAAAEELAASHVIVSFAGDVAGHLEVPYETVLLAWEVPDPRRDVEAAHQEIRHRLRELMETLRGEEAD